jgi:Cys-rich repeat protein
VCVASCMTNMDCSGGTPICNTNNHTCVECNRDGDCANGLACDNHMCH